MYRVRTLSGNVLIILTSQTKQNLKSEIISSPEPNDSNRKTIFLGCFGLTYEVPEPTLYWATYIAEVTNMFSNKQIETDLNHENFYQWNKVEASLVFNERWGSSAANILDVQTMYLSGRVENIILQTPSIHFVLSLTLFRIREKEMM